MNQFQSKNQSRLKRKKRIRAKISGSAKQPRLSVFRSLKNLSVQLIDDFAQQTLLTLDLKKIKAKNNLAGAQKLGEALAEKSQKAGINAVTFDRSGYKFHGKIKAVAEGARKGGLVF